MSIPLVQDNEKDSINTSLIAIKRSIDRINMLLGLADSGSSPDLSGLATKQELEDAITQVEADLAPVDEVTLDNMQSVSSNAVAEEAILKSNFDRVTYLGQGGSTGQLTLSDNLSKYSLILVGVSYQTASNIRTSTQLLPTLILRNRNSASKCCIASMFYENTAYIGFMYHYVDDLHIYIDRIGYSSAWTANGLLTLWGIK